MSYSQASKKYGVPLEDLKEMGTTIEKQTLENHLPSNPSQSSDGARNESLIDSNLSENSTSIGMSTSERRILQKYLTNYPTSSDERRKRNSSEISTNQPSQYLTISSETPQPSTSLSSASARIQKCLVCMTSFSDPSALKKHLSLHNLVQIHFANPSEPEFYSSEIYKCLICKKMLSGQYTIRSHLKLHSSPSQASTSSGEKRNSSQISSKQNENPTSTDSLLLQLIQEDQDAPCQKKSTVNDSNKKIVPCAAKRNASQISSNQSENPTSNDSLLQLNQENQVASCHDSVSSNKSVWKPDSGVPKNDSYVQQVYRKYQNEILHPSSEDNQKKAEEKKSEDNTDNGEYVSKTLSYCGKKFPDQVQVNYHVLQAHCRPFRCGECKRSFESSEGLIEHVKMFHKPEKS